MLYEKHNYLNKDIPYIISTDIIEYDMKEAGFSLVKKYKLLSDEKINYLDTLEKDHRKILLGLWQRSDKEFAKSLNAHFVEARKDFFNANNLQDEDVLSIKKDAIFTMRYCNITEFDDVIFRKKHHYTSYFNLNNLEFYVASRMLDCKGVHDTKLQLHKQYMLSFLHEIFKMMEIGSKKSTIRTIKEFAQLYKERALDIGFYRELNQTSLFRTKSLKYKNQTIGLNFTEDLPGIEISYNYIHYIIPLINILL